MSPVPPLPAAEPTTLDLNAPAIGIVALAVLVGMPGTVIWLLFQNGWL